MLVVICECQALLGEISPGTHIIRYEPSGAFKAGLYEETVRDIHREAVELESLCTLPSTHVIDGEVLSERSLIDPALRPCHGSRQ